MSIPSGAMRRLIREVATLRNTPPDGLRIRVSEEDMLDIIGIIAGPEGTPYEGGYFRVKFQFTEEFPAAPPKCTMLTKIFHPNVSKAGEICVNTLKKDWKKEYGIEHILVTIRCLLIYPNAESALDEAAGKLLLENYDEYCKHARIMTNVHATSRNPPPEFQSPAPSSAAPSTPSKATPSGPSAPSASRATESSTSTANPPSSSSQQNSTITPTTTMTPQRSSSSTAQSSSISTKSASKSSNSHSALVTVVESSPSEPLHLSPSNNSNSTTSKGGSETKENEGVTTKPPSDSVSSSSSGPLQPTSSSNGASSPTKVPKAGSMKRPGASGGAVAKRKKGLKRL